MSRAVEHVLSQRARRTGRRPEAASLIAALVLHGLVVAAAWALPRLQEPPKPPEFVPVTIIPAQALGVRRPAPPKPRPAPPAPEPPQQTAEEPEPAPTPEPEPEPPAPEPEDVPVLPKKEPEKKPEKKPEPAKPAETGKKPAETTKKPEPRKPTAETPAPRKPAPSQTGAAGTGEPEDRGDQTGRRGSATGNPVGTTAFGSEIAGIDNPDFTYGYYLDRLLSLIDAQWARPPLGSGIRAIVSFRIQRDGSMTDLRISESSGYNTFDLAAQRAVQNASPFPPLPRAYRHDSLGVNLIVR